jgi:hypothetical protein
LEKAIEATLEQGLQGIWTSIWSGSPAKPDNWYTRQGFKLIGTNPFPLNEDFHVEHIYLLEL